MRDRMVSGLGNVLARLCPEQAIPPGFRPARVLILKPCCLGDVILATAVVRELRLHLPRVHLAFGVGPWSLPAVQGNPRIDATVDCGRVGSGGRCPTDYLRLIRRIRAGHYECCFVLERSALLAALPYLAGIPYRIGLDSEGRGFLLSRRVRVAEGKHEAELYLDTVRTLGIEPEAPRTEFFPVEHDRRKVAKTLHAAGLQSERLVAMHPGGGINPGMVLPRKRWAPKGFAAIADRLRSQGYQVLLVGYTTDAAAIASIKELLSWTPADLSGQLSFAELGALLEGCRLLIANDTGVMHLASAVGTPVVAIFGPSDHRMYGPYGPKGIAVYSRIACSPCFRRGRYPRCDNPVCMASIGVEEVWKAVEHQLDRTVVEDRQPSTLPINRGVS